MELWRAHVRQSTSFTNHSLVSLELSFRHHKMSMILLCSLSQMGECRRCMGSQLVSVKLVFSLFIYFLFSMFLTLVCEVISNKQLFFSSTCKRQPWKPSATATLPLYSSLSPVKSRRVVGSCFIRNSLFVNESLEIVKCMNPKRARDALSSQQPAPQLFPSQSGTQAGCEERSCAHVV